MKGDKKKKIFEYNEDSDDSNDDNEFKDIEGDNIVIRDKKKKIKKDLNNFDAMQKELQKYEGKNISYNKLQNNSDEEEEENEEQDEKDNEEQGEEENDEQDDDNDEEEENENDLKPNILNVDKDKNKDNDEENEENEENEKDEENEGEGSDEDNELTLQEKMEKQDEQYLKTLSKVTKDEIRKAKNIINQKELYETFVGIRIALQNLLSDINTLPTYKNLSNFLSLSSQETKNLYSKVKNNLNQTIFDSIQFHKEFLKKQSYPTSEQFDGVLELEKILKKYQKNNNENNMEINEEEEEEKNNQNKQLNIIHNNLFKIDQKIMNIWYRKTVVNQFQTNNKVLKKLSNNDNFCEHILTSVEKNIDTLIKKTQKYNNSDLNLLGRKRLSAEEYEYDKEIFNDNDFYNFLLKEFLLNNEKEIDDSKYVEKKDENGLVEGRYDLTMRYILNKNSKIKKNVDTKASKNRKIRYDKHEEIINFMVPTINSKEISGRNIIINSLFGMKKININSDNNKEDNKEEEEKKEVKKMEEDDIELI